MPDAPRTLHSVREDAFNYVWDNALEPALEVEPGAAVELHVRDASDEQIRADSGPEDVTKLDFDHVNPVSGPVVVKGARPGDVLAVDLLEFRPPDWGWTALIPGFGLLADEFPEPWLRISRVDAAGGRVAWSDEISLPYRPFPGTIGVAPAEPGRHPILPPSRWGGNLDTKHLVAGTTLYLPVGVEGALFSLGDTHAAQGDGEVCGTAIETPMHATVRLTVRKDVHVSAPEFLTPGPLAAATNIGPYYATDGVGPELRAAAQEAVRRMIDYLGREHGISPVDAYLLCSVGCDLKISEVVDAPNWIVTAYCPLSIFR